MRRKRGERKGNTGNRSFHVVSSVVLKSMAKKKLKTGAFSFFSLAVMLA
jgi:hypothetical protein